MPSEIDPNTLKLLELFQGSVNGALANTERRLNEAIAAQRAETVRKLDDIQHDVGTLSQEMAGVKEWKTGAEARLVKVETEIGRHGRALAMIAGSGALGAGVGAVLMRFLSGH